MAITKLLTTQPVAKLSTAVKIPVCCECNSITTHPPAARVAQIHAEPDPILFTPWLPDPKPGQKVKTNGSLTRPVYLSAER
jgi:hypothetical protein